MKAELTSKHWNFNNALSKSKPKIHLLFLYYILFNVQSSVINLLDILVVLFYLSRYKPLQPGGEWKNLTKRELDFYSSWKWVYERSLAPSKVYRKL